MNLSVRERQMQEDRSYVQIGTEALPFRASEVHLKDACPLQFKQEPVVQGSATDRTSTGFVELASQPEQLPQILLLCGSRRA